MPASSMNGLTDQGLSLYGDVFLDILDSNNNSTGYLPKINGIEITLSQKGEIVKRKGTGLYDLDKALESFAMNEPTEFSIKHDSIGARKTMALQLLGTDSDISVSAGSVTDEVITARLDRWVELSKKQVTEAGFVLKSNDGLTTYIKDTDYMLDAKAAMLMALSSGAIADLATLKASFSYPAIVDGWEIEAEQTSIIRARVRFEGINRATGRRQRWLFKRVTFAANAALSLLSAKFAEAELAGTIELPSGESSPYTITDMPA